MEVDKLQSDVSGTMSRSGTVEEPKLFNLLALIPASLLTYRFARSLALLPH